MKLREPKVWTNPIADFHKQPGSYLKNSIREVTQDSISFDIKETPFGISLRLSSARSLCCSHHSVTSEWCIKAYKLTTEWLILMCLYPKNGLRCLLEWDINTTSKPQAGQRCKSLLPNSQDNLASTSSKKQTFIFPCGEAA